jgi:hypothetical protein
VVAAHRDVKPDNVMDLTAALGDLGFARSCLERQQALELVAFPQQRRYMQIRHGTRVQLWYFYREYAGDK